VPNPEKPPLFIDRQAHKVVDQVVVDSKVTERLHNNLFVESRIPQYADNLKSLRGFKFDQARNNPNQDHVWPECGKSRRIVCTAPAVIGLPSTS
jgi:hypothetical protein